MTHEIDPNSIYQDIGVTPVINAAGPITMFGGTKLRPEVHSAMNAASQTMIDLHQLNDKAGEILASYILFLFSILVNSVSVLALR